MAASQFRTSREEEGESELRTVMCLEPVITLQPLALPDPQKWEARLNSQA